MQLRGSSVEMIAGLDTYLDALGSTKKSAVDPVDYPKKLSAIVNHLSDP